MYHQALVLSTNHNEPSLETIAAVVKDILPADFAYLPSNPDIKEIRRSKNSIGIAEIQPLIAWNAQKPFQGEHKLGLIYDADSLTPEAQNSLLKTLEEPAPGTLICLIVRNRSSLLPTILSRSQHLNLDTTPITGNGSALGARAMEFLRADMLERSQIIGKLADSDESREAAIQFVGELMHQLVANKQNLPLATLNRYLETCKLAYLGLKAGTNIKLTLETVVISMS